MRIILILICTILSPILALAGTKPDSALSSAQKQYRHPMIITLDRKIALDIVANFDFSKFDTAFTQTMFDVKYSNALSASMFGKSATIYLGEKVKQPVQDASDKSRFMYVTQLKEALASDDGAKKYLAKKPGYKNQPIIIRNNKKGLKIAIANFINEKSKSYYYLLVMGTPTVLFTEANMLDPDSITIQ